MILTDVIPQKKVQKRKSKKSTLLINKVKQSEAELQQLLDLSNKYIIDKDNTYDIMNKAILNVKQTSETDRYDFFKEYGFLPKAVVSNTHININKSYCNDVIVMENSQHADFLYKLDQTPKSTLLHIKDIGEKLNLSIMPVKYVSEDCYKDEYGVSAFYRQCINNNYDCYMLGPINYLDVWKCITDKKELSQMWTNRL